MKIKVEIDIDIAEIKRLDSVFKHIAKVMLKGEEKRTGTHRYARYGYEIETPIRNCIKVEEIEGKVIYTHKSKIHKDGIHKDKQENI